MYYYFGDATPEHLRFKIITYDGLKEAGDIRLVDIKEGVAEGKALDIFQ